MLKGVRFGLLVVLLILLGCGGGVTLSSKGLGLKGAPAGSSFGSIGGAVGRLTSDGYSGFVHMGSCGLSFGGIAEGGGFLGSDPLLEVAGE